ncbi:hypothetical protein Tco_0533914 [Tanacetum coccineum]
MFCMKLTKLINSQISVNNKSGVGFDSQMNENELHDCHLNKSEVFKSASDSSVNEIEEENNQVNDRFKKVEGYHAVPPPYTGNYMPSRPDLSFAGLDDSVYKTNVSETISSVPRNESTASKSSKDSLEQPKDVRPSAPIIEEWESDSDDDSVFRPKSDQTKPKFTKINFVKSDENVKTVNKENTHRQEEYPRKSQSPRDNRRNWNGMMTQKLGNGFEFIKKACFVCGSFNHLIKDCDFHDNKMVEKPVLNNKGRVTVVTKSGQVLVNVAKQSSPSIAASISTAKPVNTAAPKSKVNDALPKTYSYFKAHSLVRRTFNQKSAAKTNKLNKNVYTAKVNNVTTARPEVVVSTVEGKRENADQGIFDSGCSRHMIGNKSYLTNYQDIDGGFVAFAGSPKGGKITGKGKIRTGKLDFEDVYFIKELKKVEENLHINFLENKPNVARSGPDWLFDIDLLTNSMNYEPVSTGNQTNKNAGIKDNVNAVPTQQYILLPLLYNSPQSLEDAIAEDAGKKTNEKPANEGETNSQEKEGRASNKEDDQNVQDFRAALDNLLVGDEAVHKELGDRMERAATTTSSLEAEQDSEPSQCRKILICYDDDDDEYSFATQEYLKKFSSAITPDLPKSVSLIMEDKHLDTILETESDELINSSVEDLVHTLSETNGISESECDLPICDDSSPKKDKVLDDIISILPGNGNDHFNAESSLIESVLNRDNVISSPKIDFLLEEFTDELALIALIPPGYY